MDRALQIELPETALHAAPGLKPKPEASLHLALGMFDGVHLGHQAVIGSAQTLARLHGGLSGVLTFDPHPSRVLRPEQATRLLQPPSDKVAVLLARGVDLVLVKRFTREYAAIPAEDFLGALKRGLPRLASLHVGDNFCFGRGRKGDVDQLVTQGRSHGVRVFSIDRLKHNGEPVSSSRIRAELEAGRIALVNELLGYPYRASGGVQPGRRLGRTLGFPTLNLSWEPDCAPARGVYAVRLRRLGESGPGLPGVANYGLRPTVERSAAVRPLLETHLLVPTDLDAGDAIEVDFIDFLRAERPFADLQALRDQIAQDVDEARARLA